MRKSNERYELVTCFPVAPDRISNHLLQNSCLCSTHILHTEKSLNEVFQQGPPKLSFFPQLPPREHIQVSPENDLQVMTSKTLPMGSSTRREELERTWRCWRPNETSHKARGADKLTYCYQKCTALLQSSLFRKGPEAALGRQCVVQKNLSDHAFTYQQAHKIPLSACLSSHNVVVQVQSQQIVSQ